MKYKKISKIMDKWLKRCHTKHNVKIPDAYQAYIIQAIVESLSDYNDFLLKNSYTDTDIISEKPTTLDRFLTLNKKS